MSEWRTMHGKEAHQVALAGWPVLLFGTPRYGPTVKREAIGHFETGRGWLESVTDRPFTPDKWQPLPPPPKDIG